jgi:hypothetical protein
MLTLVLSGCVAEQKPDLKPLPQPVLTKLVYQPIDSGLLVCPVPDLSGPLITDVDLAGAAHRILDAWDICHRHLNKIAELQKKAP